MSLDNANFIAELSITDPPGSDPLSQGDDQIRTIKRATFQSFPLIAAAVNLTDVQMNLAAIKNEANVFTAAQTIQDNHFVLDAVADVGESIQWLRSGLLRWTLTQVADAGNNDWSLSRFDDLGAFIDSPIQVDRITGIVDFTAVPTIQGDPIWTAGEIKMLVQGAALPSTNWFLCIGTNGTVDLRDRILGAQGVFTGTQTPFLDAQTDGGELTGSTAITSSQMPAHHHSLFSGLTGTGLTDTTLFFNSQVQNDTVIAGNRDNQNGAMIEDNNNNQNYVSDVGGGAGHTHTIPALEVNPAALDAFQVMPFTYFMQVIQYVP